MLLVPAAYIQFMMKKSHLSLRWHGSAMKARSNLSRCQQICYRKPTRLPRTLWTLTCKLLSNMMLQIRIVYKNRLSLFGIFQSVTLVSYADLDHTSCREDWGSAGNANIPPLPCCAYLTPISALAQPACKAMLTSVLYTVSVWNNNGWHAIRWSLLAFQLSLATSCTWQGSACYQSYVHNCY